LQKSVGPEYQTTLYAGADVRCINLWS